MMRPSPFSTNFSRWSSLLLLAGFVLGSLLPKLSWRVQAAPRQANALDVVINEVAWMGTDASYADEWIELYNPTANDIDISNWQIITADGSPGVITIPSGVIQAGGYFLLERVDKAVNDISADYIYGGGYFHNDGEKLELQDNLGNLIDTANSEGGDWVAGDNTSKSTMERITIAVEDDSVWATNDGVNRNGLDEDGNPINGTPTNSGKELIINEVAWAGTVASSDDEWIELYSPGGGSFDLTGWRLVAEDGSPDIILSGETSADGYFLLERAHGNVVTDVEGFNGGSHNQIFMGALDDAGEVLRLRAPNGMIVDTANNENGGAWPAGNASPATSMERVALPDLDTSWETHSGVSNGKDAAGNNINGSPGYPKDTAPTPTPTASNTPTATSTSTATFTPTATPTAPNSLTILINEIGWAGTEASSTDEWIELYNPSSQAYDFSQGWKLESYDGGIDIALTGVIGPGEYYLLERTDDNTISDIAADFIYSGSLSNDGEYLKLLAPDGSIVDTANNNGGDWPAGSASPSYGSMERRGQVADSSSAWITNTGIVRNGLDAEGNEINGTPKQPNWALSVTATPSPIPTNTSISPSSTPTPYPNQAVVLNEVLARPGYDWNEDGRVNVYDEFIEIINRGNSPVNLLKWQLDDEKDKGSDPYTLPSVTLQEGERIAIYGYTSKIALSDGGDTVRLLKDNGQVADVVTYTVIKEADRSWCRLPEDGFWNADCFPTPNEENTGQGRVDDQSLAALPYRCDVPDTVPEEIRLIECGLLGMQIRDDLFWDRDVWARALTGDAKYETWFH